MVRGRRLEDHLRFAVCYWHSFGWPGGDPFGGETFLRPWHHGPDPMALARAKADVAFELFRLLDVPFFTFHDADVAPEGQSLAESVANLNAIADLFEQKMSTAKVRLLWGTANLFTHRRYMAGCGDQSGSGRVRLRGRAGAGGARGDASARRPELRAVGRARGLRDAAQHRHEARTRPARPLRLAGGRAQAQDRFQGTDPDRAQAQGADQAPVRFRRRHLLRLPAALRPARTTSSSTSSRTTPFSPATRSSTRSRSPRRWASSARSTSTAATICSAGTPISSR